MLEHRAIILRKELELNCAEAILYAANEEYNMNLHKETLKAMAGFGGGMAIEEVCGAASGAVATIGILFTNKSGHESPRVKDITKDFMHRFYEELGRHNCSELKRLYRKEDIGCNLIIEAAGRILEQIVDEEINNK